MWAEETVFYQIYPLGLCGAPAENDGIVVPRILRIRDWADHLEALHIGAVYFCPVFSSDRHGYDTRDYFRVDERLGTDEDLREVCRTLHERGIRVVLDGVFNHVGRGFWAFQDVLEKRWDSPYKDWFRIDFGGDTPYHDGFWYEAWEGHYELVKLNLRNEDVIRHLFDAVRTWVDRYDIDGLRLDVAYCLDTDFIRRLRRFTEELKPEFYLIGEILGGDYRRIMGSDLLHAATNYECYKGLHSSFNSLNMFEINHSLIRQFGSDPWTLYRGMHLLSFVDNHDVTRAASILREPRHLPLLYAMCFGMPGIPCIYYGSEWGIRGEKKDGDQALRPEIVSPSWNDLTDHIARLAAAKRSSAALNYGDFTSLLLTNRQCVFRRACGEETVLVAVNADAEPFRAHFRAGASEGVDLLTGAAVHFEDGCELPPYSAFFWKLA